LELDLGRSVSVGITRLQEDITLGQSVAKYTMYGANDDAWRVLARGTTVGYAKLDRFAPVPVRRVKVVIEDGLAAPQPVVLKIFGVE
jgi:alpha-L-fucosidase